MDGKVPETMDLRNKKVPKALENGTSDLPAVFRALPHGERRCSGGAFCRLAR